MFLIGKDEEYEKKFFIYALHHDVRPVAFQRVQEGLDTFGYETPQAESAEYAVTEETTESGDKTDSDTGLGDIGEVTVADTNRKLV